MTDKTKSLCLARDHIVDLFEGTWQRDKTMEFLLQQLELAAPLMSNAPWYPEYKPEITLHQDDDGQYRIDTGRWRVLNEENVQFWGGGPTHDEISRMVDALAISLMRNHIGELTRLARIGLEVEKRGQSQAEVLPMVQPVKRKNRNKTKGGT